MLILRKARKKLEKARRAERLEEVLDVRPGQVVQSIKAERSVLGDHRAVYLRRRYVREAQF